VSAGARGAAFERAVCTQLAGAGWLTMRSAGSHGPLDVLAVSSSEVLFIQARLGGPRRVGPTEWNWLFFLAMAYGGVPLIAHRPKRGRIEFQRLLGRKEGGKGARPPCEPWMLEAAELEAVA
jgi:Holliday junction resolvase